MPSIKVDISPYVLEWILKSITLEGIDDNLLTHLYKWKNNEKQPTFAQIEEFSIKTHIPLGYFFLQTPPDEQHPLIKYRTINSTANITPTRDLMDTYYQMTAIQDWMRDYLVDAGNEKLFFVGSCKNEKNIEKIAVSIRNTIGLDIEWFFQSKNAENSFDILRKYFEEAGILIVKNGIVGQNTHRPLDINEFRAFTLIDDYAPLIFINNKDLGGKLFSLLHEVVHIWIGLNSFYNDSHGMYFNVSPLETLCNAVAAEILVPNMIFIKEWENSSNLSLNDTIEKIAKYFKCGKMIIVRKAHDNQYIANDQYQRIASEIIASIKNNNQNNKTKETGGDFYKTAISRYGTRFILALTNSIYEGKTLFKEAYKLTCTSRDTFDKLVNEVRERLNVQ